jgi:hypothetical protein
VGEATEEVAATTAATAAPAVPNGEVFFRMSSDWGSTFAGDEVQYTIVLRNINPPANDGSNDLNNITIQSTFPPNLEVQGALTDRGQDPNVAGNTIEFTLSELKPSETVEITIDTRIKPGVERGTLIVTQARATYDDLEQLIYSNIVTVLVVDEFQAATATTTATPAATRRAATTITPTGTGVAGGTRAGSPTVTGTPLAYPAPTGATPTSEPLLDTTAEPTATEAVAGGAAEPEADAEAPLPATSTGVPMAGILLFGLTLFVRQIRLHRERERI